MIDVIRHGMKPKTPYVFECGNCGCIYRSNEYVWNKEYGYVCKCPECFKNCELVKTPESEYKPDLTKSIKSDSGTVIEAEIRDNGHIYCPICKQFIGYCTGENNEGYVLVHECVHCKENQEV